MLICPIQTDDISYPYQLQLLNNKSQSIIERNEEFTCPFQIAMARSDTTELFPDAKVAIELQIKDENSACKDG